MFQMSTLGCIHMAAVILTTLTILTILMRNLATTEGEGGAIEETGTVMGMVETEVVQVVALMVESEVVQVVEGPEVAIVSKSRMTSLSFSLLSTIYNAKSTS